jgi:hypothetical protein
MGELVPTAVVSLSLAIIEFYNLICKSI